MVQLGSEVLARGFGNDDSTWLPGVVCEQRGPVSFIVKLDDGRIVRQHIDHIRSRESLAHSDSIVREEEALADAWGPTTPEDALVDPQTPGTNADPPADPSADSLADPQTDHNDSSIASGLQRSTRVVTLPERYM